MIRTNPSIPESSQNREKLKELPAEVKSYLNELISVGTIDTLNIARDTLDLMKAPNNQLNNLIDLMKSKPRDVDSIKTIQIEIINSINEKSPSS
ncbi:MAG: hypothetical protein V4629_04450 [Pseudomonadota bacterium]